MLDWGLRLVVLLAVPCSVALLVFAKPLVATLFHYGAFKDSDVSQVALALGGYGAGWSAWSRSRCWPRVLRQPGHAHAGADRGHGAGDHAAAEHCAGALLKHAGLALSIGLGALINAGCLLAGPDPARQLPPGPGWGVFALQVLAATALLAVFLSGAATASPGSACAPRPGSASA